MKAKRLTNINGVMHLFQVGDFYFAGQPHFEALPEIQKLGVKRIINLRNSEEMDSDAEKEACEKLGLDYVHVPLFENGQFNKENMTLLNDLITSEAAPHFIHCASANRVATWGITYFVNTLGMDFDMASELAMEAGLTNFNFIEVAREYLGK